MEYIFRSGQNAPPLNIVQFLPILADIIFIPIEMRAITQMINIFYSNNDKRQPKNQQIFKSFYMYFEYDFFNVWVIALIPMGMKLMSAKIGRGWTIFRGGVFWPLLKIYSYV